MTGYFAYYTISIIFIHSKDPLGAVLGKTNNTKRKVLKVPKDMLRKMRSSSGFTIIEVVITIAIGAAVMALVLNAVAGARRSQRNNARVADVGTLTGAINDYIANRNTLPTSWADIDDSVEDLNQYVAGVDLFPLNSWDANSPIANGDFLEIVQGTPGSNNELQCDATCQTTPASQLLPDDAVVTSMRSGTNVGRFDIVAVLQNGRCNENNDGVIYGGLRRIAIVYILEGQSEITCRDI